jgi:hypothetical protein
MHNSRGAAHNASAEQHVSSVRRWPVAERVVQECLGTDIDLPVRVDENPTEAADRPEMFSAMPVQDHAMDHFAGIPCPNMMCPSTT